MNAIEKNGRIIIHFGTHKTGSSSIQETLFKNEHLLDGVKYLTFGGRPNSSLFIRSAFMHPDRLIKLPTVSSTREKLAKNRQIQLRRADIEFSKIKARTTILSAEVISNLTYKELAEFIGMLRKYFNEILFVGYVRDPVSYIISALQQCIKDGHTNPKVKVSYNLTIRHLDRLVGSRNVKVFPFDKNLFPDGDVVKHFLGFVGVSFDRLETATVNESISLLVAKSLFSYYSLKTSSFIPPMVRKQILDCFAPVDGNKFTLPCELQEKIRTINRHIYPWAESRIEYSFTKKQPIKASFFRNIKMHLTYKIYAFWGKLGHKFRKRKCINSVRNYLLCFDSEEACRIAFLLGVSPPVVHGQVSPDLVVEMVQEVAQHKNTGVGLGASLVVPEKF